MSRHETIDFTGFFRTSQDTAGADKEYFYHLEEFPSANQIASCHLTHLTKLLQKASKGRYSREKAIEIREAAQTHRFHNARQIP